MPAVLRIGDNCSGHAGFPPRPSTSGSGDVYVNGIAVVRKGDPFASHTNGSSSHSSTLTEGSSTVFVDGIALGRIGDHIGDTSQVPAATPCGSSAAIGSGNVFAG